jgi:protein phosphatase PTC7
MKVSHSRHPHHPHVSMTSFWIVLVVVFVWTTPSSIFPVAVVASAPTPEADADADAADLTSSSSPVVTTTTTATATKTPSSNNSNSNSNNNSHLQSKFIHKTVIIPHDSKKHRGGEDAASTSDNILVVADGVGGWANKGVNPGLYSKLLTETIVQLYNAATTSRSSSSSLSAFRFLVDLVHKANHIAADKHLGSATCTTVQLVGEKNINSIHNNDVIGSSSKEGDGEGKEAETPTTYTINTLNIGDSGYSIHRYKPQQQQQQQRQRRLQNNNKKTNTDAATTNTLTAMDIELVFASYPGQKQFNFPYQIGGRYGDAVQDVAEMNTHTILPNDIIIVYSDGVSDNLYPHQYHTCIASYTTATTNTTDDEDTDTDTNINTNHHHHHHHHEPSYKIVSYSLIADCIARQAYFLGKDKTYDSPFAKGARESGKRYQGGKHDDITVTVAQIRKSIGANDVVSVNDDNSDDVHDNNHGDDPHYNESIFVYTETVPPQEDLPSLTDAILLQGKRRLVGVDSAADGTDMKDDDDSSSKDEL